MRRTLINGQFKFHASGHHYLQLAAGTESFPAATQHSLLNVARLAVCPLSGFARLYQKQLVHQNWMIEQC